MSRRPFLACLLTVVLVACTSTGSGDTSTTATPGASTSVTESTTTTTIEATTTSTLPEPTWTELPGVDSLPQAVQDELLGLVRKAEEIRGLRFQEPPSIKVVSDSELEQLVRDQIAESSDDFPADEALYKLLGLLDQDIDLESLFADLYGEQVAGFYDGETKELVVPMRSEGFTAVQRTTLVHELTHALTDQLFGFDEPYRALIDDDKLDQASAYQALIEGDASLAELQYVQGFSQKELGQFFAEALNVDSSTLESAPQFLQDSLLFPYDSGLAWVQAEYLQDGWQAINDAYSLFLTLPGSTEQIITPDDYQRDLPQVIQGNPPTLAGYNLERESVWGELGFRIMLDQVLGESVGIEASDGWGGDYYAQWYDGQNAAIMILAKGDTERDTEELRQALLDFALTSVPDAAYVWVEVIDGDVVFIAADEPPVGETILASLGG
ncbi:MAG: hypothetical protein WB245_00750 [Acidimicrobiia bacterium]